MVTAFPVSLFTEQEVSYNDPFRILFHSDVAMHGNVFSVPFPGISRKLVFHALVIASFIGDGIKFYEMIWGTGPHM